MSSTMGLFAKGYIRQKVARISMCMTGLLLSRSGLKMRRKCDEGR
jgi:hypothetical protein